MRKGFLGSIATLLTSVGLTTAQSLPGPEIPTAPPMPPSKPWTGLGARPPADASSSSTPWYSGFGSPKDTANAKKKTEDSAQPTTAEGAVAAGFWQPSYHVEEKKPSTSGTAQPVIGPAGIILPDEPNAFDSTPAPSDGQCGRKDLDNYPTGHIWVSVEALFYQTKEGKLPGPVLTTGGPTNVGTLGFPDTRVVLDSVNFDYGQSSGYRFSTGFSDTTALTTHTVGFEATGFLLEKRSATSSVGSDATGNPLLSRPIFNPQVITNNALIGSETAIRVSGPDAFEGHMVFNSTSRLWGLEGNFICSRMLWGPDIILGARYANLDETLAIGQQTTVLANGVAGFNGDVILADQINGVPSGPPNVLNIVDRFMVRNQFYGGQIGLQSEAHLKNFFIFLQGKVAFGENHEHLGISGSTTLSSGGVTQTTTGGIAAVKSNIGSHDHDDFAFLPEGNINIGFDVTCCFRIYAGYNFLYWSDVLRPGDTVSRTINPGLVPSSLQFGNNQGVSLPAPQFQTTSYWAHGISVGFALRY